MKILPQRHGDADSLRFFKISIEVISCFIILLGNK